MMKRNASIGKHMDLGGQSALRNAPSPDPEPPFFAHRLLMGSQDCAVEYQLSVIAIAGQHIKDAHHYPA
jgi:hypothetical protein